MYPIVNIFGRSFTTYAILAILALLLCGVVFCYFIRKAGKDDNDAIIFLLVVSVGVLIGGHLLYGVTNISRFGELFSATDGKSFLSAFGEIFGGSVFYGGLIVGGLFGIACIKIMKLDLSLYADLSAIIAPLFHGIARIGCFLGGCCYGIESEFGFVAHGNTLVHEINGVSRFPVQLLESMCNLLICAFVLALYLKGKQKGRLIFIYLLIYAIVRFLDEFLRGDLLRGFVFGLSTSQFISIFIGLFAIVGLVLNAIKSKRQKQTGI